MEWKKRWHSDYSNWCIRLGLYRFLQRTNNSNKDISEKEMTRTRQEWMNGDCKIKRRNKNEFGFVLSQISDIKYNIECKHIIKTIMNNKYWLFHYHLDKRREMRHVKSVFTFLIQFTLALISELKRKVNLK